MKNSIRKLGLGGLAAITLGSGACFKNKTQEKLEQLKGIPIAIDCTPYNCDIMFDNPNQVNNPTLAHFSATYNSDTSKVGSLLKYAKEKNLEVDLFGYPKGYNENTLNFELKGFKIRYPQKNEFYDNPLASFGQTF